MTGPDPRPLAASLSSIPDERELAVIAVERSRMAMIVTDPHRADHPIVLANQAFFDLTGYGRDEVVGRNCRLLQGPGTDRAAVARIADALRAGDAVSVDLLNYRKDGSTFWNQLAVSPVLDEAGNLAFFLGSQLDVSARMEAAELRAGEHLLLAEVNHRAMNALALVQSIVRLSRSDDPAAFAAAVRDRVDALARAHTLLAEAKWKAVPLRRILEAEARLEGSGRIVMEGHDAAVSGQAVQPLVLALHELVANAGRHGALSAKSGSVKVRWEPVGEGGRDVHLSWCETGGPPPPEPRGSGFGMTMIRGLVERELKGRLSLDWPTTGLTADWFLPRGAMG
ncbi:MAG: PAS domain-containing protein [Caulobacteraceae bacterium]